MKSDVKISAADIAAIREGALEAFPEAGWSIRDRANAAPALSSNIERFSQFLTLVGLTALVVGGVGVANAVRAYLDSKRGVIATFKSLGASGRLVFAIYLSQILAIAGIAIVMGLVVAALMPHATAFFLADLMPVAAGASIYPGALALADPIKPTTSQAIRSPRAPSMETRAPTARTGSPNVTSTISP